MNKYTALNVVEIQTDKQLDIIKQVLTKKQKQGRKGQIEQIDGSFKESL